MIVINKGHTYGKRENGKVIPINFKNGPVKLDDAEETRLVALGVAHLVFADNDDTIKENPDEQLKSNAEKPLSEYKSADLKALAKSMGIELPKKCSKPEIIALIEKASGSTNTTDETNEDDDGNSGVPTIQTQLPE